MRVGNQRVLPNCCGVDDLGGWDYLSRDLRNSGTGLFTATFINGESQRIAYEQMCREHTLLYQSPLKRNRNTRRQLFLCVFQWKPAPRQPRARPGERLPTL